MTIAENIKKYRKERGYTQKQLGEKCEMSEAMIRQYELGLRNPKLEQVRRLAAALNVSISELNPSWSVFSKTEIEEDVTGGTPLDELNLLQNYRILNDAGKHEARKRTEELTKIPEYQKTAPQNNDLLPDAAHERKGTDFTPEDRQADEDMINEDESTQ